MTFDEWYDAQPMVLIDRKTEHRLTWEAAIQQQAEIARRDARIAELEADQDKANAVVAIGNYLGKTCNYFWCDTSLASQTIDLLKEQAAEITRLKALVGKCKEVLEDSHQNINQERGFASEIEQDIKQTLAAIKEIEHD